MQGKIIVTNLGAIFRAIDKQVDQTDWEIQQTLKYVGESFVRRARLNRQFKDQTGNLQSSIGYIVAKDRRIIFEAIKGISDNQTDEGRQHGLRLATAILADYPKGYVLIGVAGMEYGIYVEARGVDVITGSIPETKELFRELIKGLKK